MERSATDPTTLIITYTAEHNHPVPTHRNSLAGTTRSKFPPLHSRDNSDRSLASNNRSPSPLSTTMTMTGFSPTTPLAASMEEELLMLKEDVQEENGDEAEEDMVSMDSDKFGDDDEEFLKKFFSDI